VAKRFRSYHRAIMLQASGLTRSTRPIHTELSHSLGCPIAEMAWEAYEAARKNMISRLSLSSPATASLLRLREAPGLGRRLCGLGDADHQALEFAVPGKSLRV
jgi:hypothetical protein